MSVCLFEWLIGQTLIAIGYPAALGKGRGLRGGGIKLPTYNQLLSLEILVL
jgi:hypothetical protein